MRWITRSGAQRMVASWTAMAMTACASGGGAYSRDPETNRATVTVGVGAGGAPSRQVTDRAQVPDVGEPEPMELPEIQDYTLGNGLRVVLVERHALPLVGMELQVRGGAAAHPPGQQGLAALTADMLDEGTTTRTALEIADAVDLLGASFSSTAGYDASQLRLTTLRQHLPSALEILADVVLHPTFPEAELERVRRERIARVIQRSDVPAALADDAFARVLYGPDHAYGTSLLGTRESLERLTRDDLVAFHRSRYVPGQATLVVAGDVRREVLDSLLSEVFDGWSGAGEDPVPMPLPAAVGERTIYLVDKPDAAQSEVRVGRVAVARRTGAYFPLTVANTVLGGSFTSRLNAKLREEKGYTYGAGSFLDMRRHPGPFEAMAAVATPVTDSAVVEFLREIDRMHEEAVPGPELERARNYVALRLPQRFETNDDVVRRISELVLHDVPLDFYERYVDEVGAVGALDVRAVAEEYLRTERMAIVIAGDRARIEEPLRALGVGPVVVLDEPGGAPGGEGR